ncbi:hypothetical protein C8Q80DRAFT_1093163 [Daedaleopsis nitida]|nr:hypothetical protein C8Q80DRAFT_1093163 [Daedaleopsis nitida]
MIHAKYTRSTVLKGVWTFLASIAFGFCAIWSMHFVGMLACRLDVEVRFDPFLTILSAVVAVLFTFAALASPYATETIENSAPIRTLTRLNRSIFPSLANLFTDRKTADLETGYAPLQTTDAEDHATVTGMDDGPGHDNDDDGSSDDDDNATSSRRPYASGDEPELITPGSGPSRGSNERRRPSFSIPEARRSSSKSPARSARHRLLQRALTSVTPRASHDSTPTETSTTSSSDSSSFTRNLSGTTLAPSSLSSWGEPLRAGLSRETRLRIKARAKERPEPEFGWRYWAKMHYRSITVFLFVRAVIWAAAIAFMHYCGMWAMIIPMGRVSWDLRVVALSYVAAFTSHLGRQMAFSTIAALGCCSMHYTGMAAATFYTFSPPSPHPGYPAFLPFTIVGIAVMVCVVSNALLAHAAISARNKMAEMILTKRRLWRIMAEKEAAEQAIELKQQFISVASHEIRTPLHTVNGYCELLARTDLTDEQSLYVTSIQQACHAINVIAGNLDRNNVELSARPVHMEVRKMIEDIAKITEARGLQPGSHSVDVIVWVAKEVPHAVYLDETYAFRVTCSCIFQLLSNAQKFCDQGYICLSVSMSGPDQLCVQVSDTGCGIPKSFRSALFEPFRQADTSLTRQHRQGTGLGLSIVKHLVQRMSGTVDVESVEGEGSTFTVQLPVTLPSRSPSPAIPPQSQSPQQGTKRIRVVYRNPRSQEQFIRLWKLYGYTALPGAHLSPVSELEKDVDTIWTDSDTVASSPGLRRLMSSPESVAVFVVHSDINDLAPLEPDLNEGRNVVLVKRPVIMHTVVEWIEAPGERLGAHVKASKVRFALPRDGNGDEKDNSPEPGSRQDVSVSSPVLSREKDQTNLEIQANGHGRRREEGNTPTTATLPTTSPSEKLKVLLVEDNMINQRLGCRLLEKLGYEVMTANDGKQALDALRKTYFVCCLMDCQMPVLDGFEATKQIRELEQSGQLPDHLPIIALTANVTQESEGDCKAAGMDHFLPKPLKMAGE